MYEGSSWILENKNAIFLHFHVPQTAQEILFKMILWIDELSKIAKDATRTKAGHKRHNLCAQPKA